MAPDAPPVVKSQPSRQSRAARFVVIAVCVITMAGAAVAAVSMYVANQRAEQSPEAKEMRALQKRLARLPDTPPESPYDRFMKLEEGMSFATAEDTMGSKGTLQWESGNMAEWDWRFSSGVVEVTFQNGHLRSKHQVGLK